MLPAIHSPLVDFLRRAGIAAVAGGAIAAPAYAESGRVVVVAPADLPVLARQSGQALLLHETSEGRSLLYVEQDQGHRLAIFDVTDPSRVQAKGAVELEASGPFEFAAPLGDSAELVEFRNDEATAVLDLRRPSSPSLGQVQRHELEMAAATPAAMTNAGGNLQLVRNDPRTALSSDRLFDDKPVRSELTSDGTDTTYVLTDAGLYLVRHPQAEIHKQLRDQQRAMDHAPG